MSICTKREAATSSLRSLVLFVSAASALTVYLFVNAPPALSAQTMTERRSVPIAAVLALLEHENDAARALWTEDIVKRGNAVGLAFGEHWHEERVHEGPLPALFLRETARQLERTGLRVSMFLGSRFPINTANQLTGEQAARLEVLERTGAPQFFYEPSTKMQTAMFADRAVVQECARCHNEHPDSPKRDWRVDDVMGATTWMYPDEMVTVERAIEMIGALRTSIRAAYASYLEKAARFPRAPQVGTRWPKNGNYLPSVDVLMAELARRTSTVTVQGLIDPRFAVEMTSGELAAAAPPSVPAEPEPALVAPPVPQLVIRSSRSTRIVVDQQNVRLMTTRLPAGAATSLTWRPPLRIRLSQPTGVEIEYAGKKVPIPAPVALDNESEDQGSVEVLLPELREES